MKRSLLGATVSVLTIIGAHTAQPAFAQEASAQADPEAEGKDESPGHVIIVTAQRREQNLQDVPIAVTSLNSETLVKSGTTNLDGLTATTPGLSGKNQGTATAIFSIRGINTNSFGVGGDNSVGIFVDDVFIGRSAISGVGFLDPERIEVLKGPQGTLFGRNSTAGAISIVSKKPDHVLEGELRLSYGNLDSLEAFGAITIPLVEDRLAIRIAGLRREQDGSWIDVAKNNQRVGDNELWAGRLSALWDVTDRLSVEAFYAIWREEVLGFPWGTTDPNLVALAPGSSADPFDRRIAHDVEQFEFRDADVAGLTFNYEVSDDITIKSISSYTRLDDQGITDVDASILPIIEANFGPDPRAQAANPGLSGGKPGETFGQEFRINGTTDRLDWLVGASFFAETIDEPITLQFDDNFIVGGTPIAANSLGFPHPAFAVCDPTSDAILGPCNPQGRETVLLQGDYQSFAVFGDLRYAVTDALTLTAGLRYNLDEKEFTYTSFIEPSIIGAFSGGSFIFPQTGGAPVVLEDDWNDLQPRFVIDYRWNDDLLTYASISRGFKAGGFDISQSPADIPFSEEQVWAYELGFKSELADGKVILNAAAYFNDYEGLQVQTIVAGIQQTVNVPTLDSYGFEVELSARPTENLDINLGLALNESEFGTFITDSGNLEGNRVPQTPRWTINGSAEYRQDLSPSLQAYVRGDVNYRSREFETIENLEVFSQEGYWLVNGRIGLKDLDHGWEVSAYAQNLLDQDYLTFSSTLGFGLVQRAALPRRYGVELRKTF